ncbi:MAG: carboxypeptidase regulatory-like domain-containing protein [Blastocatellales bacterium]
MPIRTLASSLAILFLLSINSVIVLGQDTVTGAFEGTVMDSVTGQPIIGATAEITNVETNIAVTKLTDARGRFYQGLLAPGLYRIRVTMTGYQPNETFQRLKIARTGEVVPVPVNLDPLPAGAATPPTTPPGTPPTTPPGTPPTTPPGTPPTTPAVPPPAIPAAAATAAGNEVRSSINTVDARRSGSFSEEDVSALPLGGTTFTRTFDELALLLPGVAPPPQTLGSFAGPGQGAGVGTSGQFAVNGLRSRGNNFTVDGSDNNDEDIGVRRQGFLSLVPQPIESIREYQAITLLAPAQFGRNFGANVNAVSKSGGNQVHGNLFGFFNSSQLNARNFFDSANGNDLVQVRANSGAAVTLDGQPLRVRNHSGGEDSFTLGKVGGTLGGPLRRQSTFYFLAAEGQLINATQEENFAVPSIEQRGIFGSGATGIAGNPLGAANSQFRTRPTNSSGDAFYSLFPFANNPNGIYGSNTYTQVLPASARGIVASAKLDHNFNLGGLTQSFTSRYNYTDDRRELSKTGEAIFSTLEPKVRAQNLSLYFNSQLSGAGSSNQIFNQVRVSYGRTRLRFNEVRPCLASDAAFSNDCVLPSDQFPNQPFLINRASIENQTLPGGSVNGLSPDQQRDNSVIYRRLVFNRPIHTEDDLGPIGQVNIAGFSPLGVDVDNFPQTRVNNTYQIADVLTWRVGNHSMAFGTDNRRSELNSNLPRVTRPSVAFNGAPPLLTSRFFKPEDLAATGVPSNFFLTLTNVGNQPVNTAADLSLRFYQLNFFAQDDWRILPNLSLAYGLRYETNTTPRDTNDRIERTFGDPSLDLVPGLRTFIGNRDRIFEPDRNNFAPRVSLAYSPNLFGKDRATVFRAGFGMFYDQILGAVVSQSRNVYPTFLSLNFGGLFAQNQEILLSYVNPATTSFQGQPLVRGLNRLNLPLDARLVQLLNQNFPPAFGLTLPTQRLKLPNAFHYTLAFEQQLSRELTLSFAYVGTGGRSLLRFSTPNLGPGTNILPTQFSAEGSEPLVFGRICVPSGGRTGNPTDSFFALQQFCGARPVSDIGAVSIFETSGTSQFDSYQMELRGRFFQSLQLNASYVLSSARDDVSEAFDLAGAPSLPQNSRNFAGERAPANFDIRHRGTFSAIYDMTSLKDKLSGMGWALNGLQIAAIGRIQGGQPFTVNSVYDVNLDGNLTDRLNSVDGLKMNKDGRQPIIVQTTNLGGLLATTGSDGQIQRNAFRAGGLVDVDVSVSKAFTFTGSKRILIRADFFNVFNRRNFGIPVRLLEAPGFGTAVQTVTPGLRVQFGLKFEF